jgi:hypothetical protein
MPDGSGGANFPGVERKLSGSQTTDAELDGDPLPGGVEAAQLLARVRGETNPNRQRRQIYEACAALDAAGIRALLAAIGGKNVVFSSERWLMDALLTRWTEIEPQAAAEYLAQANRYHQMNWFPTVMAMWAQNDPDAAQEWALGCKNPEQRRFAINGILTALAEADPEEAMAFLDDLPVGESRLSYISDLFRIMAQKSPARAAEIAKGLDHRGLQQPAIFTVASVWGQTEPVQALTWLLQNSTTQVDGYWQIENFVGEIAQSWVRTSPREAADFAAALPPGEMRSALIGRLGESWGATDPQAAAKWLTAMPKSAETYRAFDSLIRSWSRREPAQAADFLVAQPAERTRDWLLRSLGDSWAMQDPTAALAWAQKQSAPEIERQIAAQALGQIAAKDFSHVDRYLGQLKTAEARTAAIAAVAGKLGDRDPQAAASWVMQIAQTQEVGRAIESPVMQWTWRDPDAVSGWLNEQPPSAQKDAAVGVFAEELVGKDAPSAATWASTIVDEKARKSCVDAVVTKWAEKDAAAARAWVDGQGFAEARQKELQKMLDRAIGK